MISTSVLGSDVCVTLAMVDPIRVQRKPTGMPEAAVSMICSHAILGLQLRERDAPRLHSRSLDYRRSATQRERSLWRSNRNGRGNRFAIL